MLRLTWAVPVAICLGKRLKLAVMVWTQLGRWAKLLSQSPLMALLYLQMLGLPKASLGSR